MISTVTNKYLYTYVATLLQILANKDKSNTSCMRACVQTLVLHIVLIIAINATLKTKQLPS